MVSYLLTTTKLLVKYSLTPPPPLKLWAGHETADRRTERQTEKTD